MFTRRSIMKKYIVIIIIVVLLIIGGIFLYQKSKDTETNHNNENTVNFENINTVEGTIYVGYENTYIEFNVEYNKNLETIDQAKFLIQEIGNAIGYKIIVNDITSGKGGMSIDFSSEGAPFNDTDTYVGNERQHIFDRETLIYTIFDSIKETLQKHFGENMDVWYTVDNLKEIEFEQFNFKIAPYTPYIGINSVK